jgi:hypothetical protein
VDNFHAEVGGLLLLVGDKAAEGAWSLVRAGAKTLPDELSAFARHLGVPREDLLFRAALWGATKGEAVAFARLWADPRDPNEEDVREVEVALNTARIRTFAEGRYARSCRVSALRSASRAGPCVQVETGRARGRDAVWLAVAVGPEPGLPAPEEAAVLESAGMGVLLDDLARRRLAEEVGREVVDTGTVCTWCPVEACEHNARHRTSGPREAGGRRYV